MRAGQALRFSPLTFTGGSGRLQSAQESTDAESKQVLPVVGVDRQDQIEEQIEPEPDAVEEQQQNEQQTHRPDRLAEPLRQPKADAGELPSRLEPLVDARRFHRK